MPGPFQTDGIMDEKTYDGWTNYQTWAVALRIDSEQASCQYWRDEARRHRTESPAWRQVRDGIWIADEAAEINLADQLKKELNDAPLTETNAYNDLLGAALSEVNWSEIAEHLLADVAEAEHPLFGPVISAYTRAQAIADGVLVDASEMAREAGLKYPTALTATVWGQYVAVPEGVKGQDERGRLWDILMMLRLTLQNRADGSQLRFDLLVQNDNTMPKPVTLKAICGPGDTPDPVITIMLPNED